MTAGTAFEIEVPITAANVAAEQREIEALATPAELAAIVVRTEADYAAADAFLTELLSKRDAIVGMRKSATGPLYGVIKTVEGWFKPYVDASAKVERRLRDEMNGYLTAKARAADEARAAALEAAKSRDTAGMVVALTKAADASAKPAGGATVKYRWAIKAIDEAALPPEFWTPNIDLIMLHASHAGPDGPEPIPGVTFERQATIGAKRK